MNVGKSICPMQFEKFEFPQNNGTSRAWHSTIFCAFSKKCYLVVLSLSCDSRISTAGKFPHVMRICARGNWLFEGRLNSVLQQRFGDFPTFSGKRFGDFRFSLFFYTRISITLYTPKTWAKTRMWYSFQYILCHSYRWKTVEHRRFIPRRDSSLLRRGIRRGEHLTARWFLGWDTVLIIQYSKIEWFFGVVLQIFS